MKKITEMLQIFWLKSFRKSRQKRIYTFFTDKANYISYFRAPVALKEFYFGSWPFLRILLHPPSLLQLERTIASLSHSEKKAGERGKEGEIQR